MLRAGQGDRTRRRERVAKQRRQNGDHGPVQLVGDRRWCSRAVKRAGDQVEAFSAAGSAGKLSVALTARQYWAFSDDGLGGADHLPDLEAVDPGRDELFAG